MATREWGRKEEMVLEVCMPPQSELQRTKRLKEARKEHDINAVLPTEVGEGPKDMGLMRGVDRERPADNPAGEARPAAEVQDTGGGASSGAAGQEQAGRAATGAQDMEANEAATAGMADMDEDWLRELQRELLGTGESGPGPGSGEGEGGGQGKDLQRLARLSTGEAPEGRRNRRRRVKSRQHGLSVWSDDGRQQWQRQQQLGGRCIRQGGKGKAPGEEGAIHSDGRAAGTKGRA